MEDYDTREFRAHTYMIINVASPEENVVHIMEIILTSIFRFRGIRC